MVKKRSFVPDVLAGIRGKKLQTMYQQREKSFKSIERKI